jgi:AcrR family transcriptional regulator
MKPPTQRRKEASHERIVAAAARAVRRAGFHGVGVADVMKEAGLTHGGFYAHFPSRDALLCEAVERAGQDSAARMTGSDFRVLVERYLSDRHAASPEQGCPVAALASEIPRQSQAVTEAAAQRVRDLVSAVRRAMPPGTSKADAAAVAGQMVGSLQLARALGGGMEGRAMLAAARRTLLARYAQQPIIERKAT